MKAPVLVLLLLALWTQARVQGQENNSGPQPSDKLFELGRQAAEQNKESDAIVLLCTFISNYPTHDRVPEALERLGKVYHSNHGKRDELIGCLRKLTDQGEDKPQYRSAMNWIETHEALIEWEFADVPPLVRAVEDQEIKVALNNHFWQRPHLPSYRLYRIPPDEIESDISELQTSYSVVLNGGKDSRERWELVNVRAELFKPDPNNPYQGFGWERDLSDTLHADFSVGGVFVLEQEIEGFSKRFVIHAPKFGLFCKAVGDRIFVYAADVWTGQPMENLEVGLRSDRSRRSLRTNDQGVVSFPHLDEPPWPDPSNDDKAPSVYVIARLGNDVQACPVEPADLSQSIALAFITTDRPVYRPSQTVHFKAVIRERLENRLVLSLQHPLQVEIRDPQGRLVQSQELQLNKFGSLSGSFQLTDEPALGDYQVIVHVARPLSQDDLDNLDSDWARYWSQTFEVAEYRKPEFEVTVKPQGDSTVPGEQMKATVNARYYFGGAVKNADVQWTVIAYPAVAPNADVHQYQPFEDPRAWFYESQPGLDSQWTSTSVSSGYWWRPSGEPAASGEGRTNDQGELEIVFDTKPKDEPVKYKVMATVRDASRMTAQGSADIEAHPSPNKVTVGTARLFYQPGEEFEALVRVRTRDGQPAANQQLKLSAFLQVSEEAASDREFESFFSEQVQTDGQGLATLKITAPKSGRLRLRAEVQTEKEKSGIARSELWIAGEAAVDQDKELTRVPAAIPQTPPYQNHGGGLFSIPSVAYQFGGGRVGGFGHLGGHQPAYDDGFELLLDTDLSAYGHGETIRLMVRSLKTAVNGLLIIEGDQVYSTKFVRLSKRCEVLEIPVTPDLSPLVRISLLAWSDGKFAWSSTEISIYPSENLLNVAVETGQPSYPPREQARVSLNVTDADGKPVAAEVELGVVDQSLFDLAEDRSLDIRSFFFPRPALLDHSSYANVSVPAEELYAWSGGYGGGGFGGGMGGGGFLGGGPPRPFVTSVIPVVSGGGGGIISDMAETEVRSKFADTFYWSAHVTVGDDGKADLDIEVPDTLGQWRIVARAISGNDKFGVATSSVVSRKDAIVRLSAPRFFTQGDRATVSTVVNNETDKEAFFLVKLECEGAKAGGEQTRAIPATGQVRVDWPIEIDLIGTVTLRVKALSPIASDAMELKLPVRPYGIDKRIALNGRLENGSWDTTLVIPEDAALDSANLQIVVSSPSTDAIRDALPYLADYPYGCVEQTMSRFLPAVVAAGAMQRQGIENKGLAADLPVMVEHGLQRLYGFQHEDGGWGWWKHDKTNEFMTTYVVFGLLTAQQAGYEIDPETLQRGIEAVQNQPATPFSVYVLRLAKVDADVDLEDLKAQPKNESAVDPFGGGESDPFGDASRQLRRGEVSVALQTANRAAARKFSTEELAYLVLAGYQELADQLPAEPPKNSGPSQVRTTALLVRAFASIDRNDARISPLVEWLMQQRRGGAWYSTLDTAYAVFALSELVEPGNDVSSLEVVINGKRKESNSGRISMLPEDLRRGANKIEIRQNDDKRLVFASVLLNYFGTDLDTPASDKPTADESSAEQTSLEVRRKFERGVIIDGERQWQPIASGSKITINDELRVTTIVSSTSHVERVMIESPLPAGTEPRVDEIGDEDYWDHWFGRRELRDDRVSVAANHIHDHENEFEFRLRPTLPGRYRILPAQAFLMYDPDHQAHSPSFLIEVVDAE